VLSDEPVDSDYLDADVGALSGRDLYTEKFISAANARQLRSPLFRRI